MSLRIQNLAGELLSSRLRKYIEYSTVYILYLGLKRVLQYCTIIPYGYAKAALHRNHNRDVDGGETRWM